jgi:predicted O-methyltransferase YrrM
MLRRLGSCVDLTIAADFAFGSGFLLLFPLQIRSEIMAFLASLNAEPPKVVVEIGTAFGGTLFLLCRAAQPESLIVSIDMPGGGFVGPFGRGSYGAWRLPFLRAFAGPRQDLRLLRQDSHLPATLEDLKHQLRGKAIDLLFIDGDHTYEGVRRDFDTYSPLVRPGGWVAFHDINPGPPRFGGEVSLWWREVKEGREYREFVADASQLCCGIGALRMGSGA